jgi:hypothetical protein
MLMLVAIAQVESSMGSGMIRFMFAFKLTKIIEANKKTERHTLNWIRNFNTTLPITINLAHFDLVLDNTFRLGRHKTIESL